MTALLRRLRGEESGFTLMELLVSMIMLGIVGTIVVTASSNALRSNANDEVTVTKTADAHIALDRISRALRAAADPIVDQTTQPITYGPGIIQAGPFSVTYYTNVKNLNLSVNPNGALAPNIVQDQVQKLAGQSYYSLTETVWTPTANAASAANPYSYTYPNGGTTTTLASGLPAPIAANPALFTYQQPVYFSAGTATDVQNGANNCAATAPIAASPVSPAPTVANPLTSLWVGAESGVSVATTVGSVVINLLLVGTGQNAPQFATTSKTLAFTTTVSMDAANNYTSRSGTCQ